MKLNAIIIVTLLAFQFGNAQIGMGTDAPDSSAALDVYSDAKGLLIPRLSSTEISEISYPAKGLMVYNTNENRIQYNSGTSEAPIWSAMKQGETPESEPYYTTKFKATNTNKNYNTPGYLQAFQSLVWNDNPDIYNKKNKSKIEVKQSGRYLITVNVALKNLNSESLSNFMAPEIRLEVNNADIGSYASTGFSAVYSGHTELSLNLTEVLELNANDKLRVKVTPSAGSGVAKLRSSKSTFITIEKLQ